MAPEKIKRLRQSYGETQVQFAKRVGVAWNTIARWERGEVKPRGLSLRALQALKRL